MDKFVVTDKEKLVLLDAWLFTRPVCQHTLPATRIENEELKNVYAFVYLGSEIAGDGNPEITIRHRINVGWGRFGDTGYLVQNPVFLYDFFQIQHVF